MRNFLGSEAAESKGSSNLAGIADPVVDALVEKMLAAQSRDELRVAARALDRVLRAKHFWVPQFYSGTHKLAFWDRFSWPETKPKYDRGVVDTWWYDAEKAAKLNQ
jgi:microcin C transport system substrate-binding protein